MNDAQCLFVDGKCSKCGRLLPPDWPPDVHVACRSLQPAEAVPIGNGGPGTEATLLLKSLDIAPVAGCDCKGFALQMDRWGVAGCREHFEQIVAHFRQYQSKYGWAAKFKAASLAAVTGLAFKLNWLDPLPDLVTEAIRRAEEKEKAAQRPESSI